MKIEDEISIAIMKKNIKNIKELIYKLNNTNMKKTTKDVLLDKLYKSLGEIFYNLHPKVDSREAQKMIELMEEIGWEVATMKVSDFSFSNIFGAERKEKDFLSMERLFQQLHELKSNFDYSYLVITRNFDDVVLDAKKRGMNIQTVIGFLGSIVDRGFVPLFISNKNLGRWIISTICEKHYDQKNRDIYVPLRPRPKPKDYANGMIELCFGRKTTQKIFKNFNSVKEIVNVSKEELMKVNGVGEKKAKRFFNIINNK